MPTRKFSDYIIYVDESGDHGLDKIDSQYPIFVLAFCIVNQRIFTHSIVPEMKAFKFKYFGHDTEILHEREIRRSENAFRLLKDPYIRGNFFSDLDKLMEGSNFEIVACAIDKLAYSATAYQTKNPYDIAARYGLERVFLYLKELNQIDRTTFVIFESRGEKEDEELMSALREIESDTRYVDMKGVFEFRIISKSSNQLGLQIADLVARPLGLHVLRPNQPNRASEIALRKVRRSPAGSISGWGLKIVP